MAGVKEIQEVVIGGLEVGLLAVKRLKDGVQLEDGLAFWDAFSKDGEVKSAVVAAYENFKAVPEEVSDLDISEVIQLGGVVLAYVPKFVAAVKG